ncbi:Nucleotide-diphospho-sugar transferases [Moorella glycerini]|uniref:N-acylneuraminate cytidylyltransferase n=1 Tax=Neomoorella stamsii TaxID=1266720 RepID=A0A9X7P5X0_9FIRM|nr:acylneuraminate cytidylyltransferase family protein [Moorella stamsii]PRR72308.1 N-acylneuraminate cytidylyltransferase [Moorella stamsii]CEP68881.1 Nucleotide-diphospho-sugar transferases [Moorella glycerini]
MYRHKTLLGFIPARKGSKGVPGKNIKPLAGKPLIVYTIETARVSGLFDYLMVSTDGEDIARIVREAGAEVPFVRPAELATDTAKGIDVLHHAMVWLEAKGQKFDWVMYLQPTSPLRSSRDIVAACELMLERDAEAVVAVCEVEHHPWWSNTLPDDLCMADFLRPEAIGPQRQELPTYYRINGAIYLARWDFIRYRDSWYGPRTYAYIMPRERSVDIDNPLDFVLAEALIYQK